MATYNFIDLTGKNFGRWTVIEQAGKTTAGNATWLCQCECEVRKVVIGTMLRTGKSLSCSSCSTTTHGMCGTSIYTIWQRMLDRCENSTGTGFHNYGGRGITVCERWHSFEKFYADMGQRPKGMSLDRINNDGHYEPGNCRWATQKQQNRNSRNNRLLTIYGKSQCVADWADISGTNSPAIFARLNYGWPSKEAVFGRSADKSLQTTGG